MAKKATKATLYGANGKKEIVDVGSQRAKTLQSQGWGTTPGSYKPRTATTGGDKFGKPGHYDINNVVAYFKGKGYSRNVTEQDVTNANKYGLSLFDNQAKKDPTSLMAPSGGSSGGGSTGDGGGGDGGGSTTGIEMVDFKIPGTDTTIKIPKDLSTDPTFLSLDATNQGIAAYTWNTYSSQNSATIQAFTDALSLASKQADPYWGEIFNTAKDSVLRSVATSEANLQSTEADLVARRDKINQDLTTNSANLTAEQQASLATQADQFDQQINQLRQGAASTGLSSSTIALRARDRQAKLNENVVGDINRSTQYALDTNARNAAFDQGTIDRQKADAERQTLESKTSAVRGAEAIYGSDAMKGLGFDNLLLGGITGSEAGAKASDILSRVQALLGVSIPASSTST